MEIAFSEGWSWFKFNKLGLALDKNLKFYNSVTKWLKKKVRTFLGLILTFVEVTGGKLEEEAFYKTKYCLNYHWKINMDHLNSSLVKSKFLIMPLANNSWLERIKCGWIFCPPTTFINPQLQENYQKLWNLAIIFL